MQNRTRRLKKTSFIFILILILMMLFQTACASSCRQKGAGADKERAEHGYAGTNQRV